MPDADLPEQVRVRHRTLKRLRAAGTDTYPVGVAPRTMLSLPIPLVRRR
ncbi:hypothetical protein ACGFNV_04175 [Streptomyces sp. NPDC048751]